MSLSSLKGPHLAAMLIVSVICLAAVNITALHYGVNGQVTALIVSAIVGVSSLAVGRFLPRGA